MKNFTPVKRSIALAMLILTLALIIGTLSTTVFADNTAADDTATVTETATAETVEEDNTPYEVNTSFWDTIAIPFGYIMRGCSFITGGIYPLALLVFALAMKIVLFPFGIKQQKNSQKQAKLRPKEQAIRDKYAGRNDKVTQQKMTQEIQELYQKEGFNPMGGCLPLLLQFPILFALFRVVYNPIRHVIGLSFDQINTIANNIISKGIATKSQLSISNINYDMGVLRQLRDMSAENFKAVTTIDGVQVIKSQASLPKVQIFGIDLCTTPMEALQNAQWLLILIPIVTFIGVYLSMKLTKKFTYQPQQNADMAGCSGTTMDLMMPLMSTFFAFMYPAVLGIYWVYQNILGVAQQFILAKVFPLPKFTEADYAKAKQEMFGKQVKKKKNAGPARRNPKSLHHIDDDDDDEEIYSSPKNKTALKDKDSLPKSENSLIEPAVMKDDIPAPDKKEEE